MSLIQTWSGIVIMVVGCFVAVYNVGPDWLSPAVFLSGGYLIGKGKGIL